MRPSRAPSDSPCFTAVCNNAAKYFSARPQGQLFPDLYTGPNFVNVSPRSWRRRFPLS